jgi:hypothetical protein
MRGIYKKINSIRPASYKFVRKTGIIQENLSTEQVSNRRTRNNRNRNNQPDAAEEVSAEEFHYEELTPEQMAALHQKRWAQHLDGGLNRWGIMTSNGSESLNNVFRSLDNFRYMLSSRTRGTNVLSGSISVDKLQQFGKPKSGILPKGHRNDKTSQ